MIFEWDELNLMREEARRIMSLPPAERKKQKDKYCDYLEFVLCLVYGYGWREAEKVVGIVPFKDGLDDICVNLEIENKTFRQRAEEYLADENATEAEMIRLIDTESVRDYNTGVIDAGKASGMLGVRKRWNTMMDGRVRETHDYLHGMEVGLNDRFYTFDGDSADAPGGFTLPENNINCRCWVTLQT